MSNNPIPEDLRKPLLYVAGGTVGIVLISKGIKNAKQKDTQDKVFSDPNKEAAFLMSKGLNPSGIGWLIWTDGYDLALIKRGAKLIADWAKTQQAYKDLTKGDDLLRHLKMVLIFGNDFDSVMTLIKGYANNTDAKPFLYDVGDELTFDKGYTKISLQDQNVNNSDEYYREGEILKRDRLTLTKKGKPFNKVNFYQVRCDNKGLFTGDTIVWVPEP